MHIKQAARALGEVVHPVLHYSRGFLRLVYSSGMTRTHDKHSDEYSVEGFGVTMPSNDCSPLLLFPFHARIALVEATWREEPKVIQGLLQEFHSSSGDGSKDSGSFPDIYRV